MLIGKCNRCLALLPGIHPGFRLYQARSVIGITPYSGGIVTIVNGIICIAKYSAVIAG
jgi:hypothetical protein